MSGLIRNFFAVLAALWRYNTISPQGCTSARFFITPLDTGLATLKSDKYLQLAEAAQVDYLLQTGLMGRALAGGYSFVNASLLVRFIKPVRLFSRVRVDTEVAFADGKCVYFVHRFHASAGQHAEVLVKMKFKKGRLTVAPAVLLGDFAGAKPAWAQRWDEMLAMH